MRDKMEFIIFYESIVGKVRAFCLIESHHWKHNFLSSHHRAIQTVAARYTQVIIVQNMAVSVPSLLHKLPLSPAIEYQEC